ncbi:MAG: S1 RNA-binding domain-containing protein [Candidatus Woesearchaeota archaeon]
MLFRRDNYPEEEELVMCTVTKVQPNSVFVNVDEYQKQGMIHISEISPGRIRNIRDFVKEGKVVVCKVLRVNLERGHIDLSLRRVNESQKRAKVEEMKQEQKAEKIVEFVAKSFNLDPVELYRDVFSKVKPDYDMLQLAFAGIVDNKLSLEKLGIEKNVAEAIEQEVRHRTKPTEVRLAGNFSIKTYEPEGVQVIKDSLGEARKVYDKVDLKYLGAGKYQMHLVANDFEAGEELLQKVVDSVVRYAESHNAECSFVKE